MGTRGILAILAGAMGLCAPAKAAAPPDDQETSPEKLLDRGFERMEQRDFRGALSLFRRANDIKRSGQTLAQIGLAEQGLERLVNAEAHVMDGLAMAGDPWIGKWGKVLEIALDTVRAHLAALMVRGTPVGAICFSTYDTRARGWAALGGGSMLMVLGMYTLVGSF